jgi:hypothetical protein
MAVASIFHKSRSANGGNGWAKADIGQVAFTNRD